MYNGIMSIKSYLSNYKTNFISKKREQYNLKKRSRLKGQNYSIISRNCVGGIIYHDLGLKFNSPTINLSMDNEDFLTFLENLDSFLTKSEMVQIVTPNQQYPVGQLKFDDKCITLNFVHYKTFEEGRDKWFERSKRVDLQNVFIIWEFSKEDGPSSEIWQRFCNIKYKNKILLTGNKFNVKDRHVLKLSIYGSKYHYGKILEYRKGFFLYKRYLDQFNYVDFLNKNFLL